MSEWCRFSCSQVKSPKCFIPCEYNIASNVDAIPGIAMGVKTYKISEDKLAPSILAASKQQAFL